MNRNGCLGMVLLLLAILSISLGEENFWAWNYWTWDAAQQDIFKDLLLLNRLPRTVLAILVGASCALSGLILQTIFKNSLAGPTTLGVNSGASLGIALYYFLWSSLGIIPNNVGGILFAAMGALLFLFLIIWFNKRFSSVSSLLIVGILLGYMAFALIEILIQSSDSLAISNYVFWGMGSFNFSSWYLQSALFLLLMTTIVWTWLKSGQLNLYLLGEEELTMAGINSRKLKRSALILTGILIGTVTAIVGPIAFLGIIVPNLLKLSFKTVNHQKLIPSVLLLGAAMALLSDILSRGILFEKVLPLNAVLSLLSIPVLLILFLNRKNEFEV